MLFSKRVLIGNRWNILGILGRVKASSHINLKKPLGGRTLEVKLHNDTELHSNTRWSILWYLESEPSSVARSVEATDLRSFISDLHPQMVSTEQREPFTTSLGNQTVLRFSPTARWANPDSETDKMGASQVMREQLWGAGEPLGHVKRQVQKSALCSDHVPSLAHRPDHR